LNFRALIKLFGTLFSGAVIHVLLRKLFDDHAISGTYIPIPLTPDRPVIETEVLAAPAETSLTITEAPLTITATGNFPVAVAAADVRLEPFAAQETDHSNLYLRIKRKKKQALTYTVSTTNPPRNIDANTVEVTIIITETVPPGSAIALGMYCDVPSKFLGFAIVRKS